MLKRIAIRKFTDVKAYETKLELGKDKLTLIIENGDNKVMNNEGNKLTAYFKEFTVLAPEQVRPIDALLIPGMVVKFERLFIMGDVLKAYEFMHELLPRMVSLKEINVFGECDDSLFESIAKINDIRDRVERGSEFVNNSMRTMHGWGFDKNSNAMQALANVFVDVEKIKSEVNSSAEIAGEINAQVEHALGKLTTIIRSNQKNNGSVMLITQDAPYIWEPLRATLGQGTSPFNRENPACEIAPHIPLEIYSLNDSSLSNFIDWCRSSKPFLPFIRQIVLDIRPYKWEEIKPLLVDTFPNLSMVHIPGGESFTIEEFEVLSKVKSEEDTYELRRYFDDNSKYVYCGTQKRFDRGYRVDDSAISLTIGVYMKNPLLPSLEILNEDESIDEVEIDVSPSFEIGNEFFNKENNTRFELLEWLVPNQLVKVRNTFSDEISQIEVSKLIRSRVELSDIATSNKEYESDNELYLKKKDTFDVDNHDETIINGKRYICMNSTEIKFLEGTEVLAMVDGKEVNGTYVSDLNDIMYLIKLADGSGSIGVEKGNVYVPVPDDKPLRINLNKDRLNNFIFFNQFSLNNFKDNDKVLFVSDFLTDNDKLAIEQMKKARVTFIHMTSKEFIKIQTESTGPVEIYRIVVLDVCNLGKQACINIAQGMNVLKTLIVFNNTDTCSTEFNHNDYSLNSLAEEELINSMKAMHDGKPVNIKDNFRTLFNLGDVGGYQVVVKVPSFMNMMDLSMQPIKQDDSKEAFLNILKQMGLIDEAHK